MLQDPLSSTRWWKRAWFIVALCLFGLGLHLSAIDEAEVDFTVLDELNRLELYDYAEMLLGQLEKAYPKRRDAILIEKARLFYACGKSKEADQALSSIKPGSSAYANALLLQGEVAAKRGRYEDAAKAYETFFQQVSPPKANRPRAVDRYTRAVTVYSTVLKRLGRGEEAAKALERLGKITGTSDRKLTFLKAQAVLDAEDATFRKKKPIDRTAIERTIKQLQGLQYVRDGVAASAYLEMARANILLAGDELNTLRAEKKGRKALKIQGFKKALKIIKMADEADLFKDIEKQVARKGARADSPYAGALFYKGEAYRGLALAYFLAGQRDKARKLALAAAKLYEAVLADYGQSAYKTQALSRHGKVEVFLNKIFGEKIELADNNRNAEMDLKIEQARTFLHEHNFHGAIPLYLEALRLARRSKRLPDIAVPLVVCYGNLEHFLEAEAICSYLADVLPHSEGTAEGYFRLGATMYEKAKTHQGSEATALRTRAMSAWEHFVDLAPDHSRAPDVAFAIAEHYNKLAADIVAQSRLAENSKKREALKAKARDAYALAVPKYQRLVNRYGSMDKGKRALYKLGWIYSSIGKTKESIDAFLRYVEAETDPKFAEDRLEAKFQAAEQLMLSDEPVEAADHFRELLAWLASKSGKGFKASSPVVRRLREDSLSYLAWSYDLAGEQQRPAMEQLQEDVRRWKKTQEENKKREAAAQQELQAIAKARKEAERTLQERRELLQHTTLDFSEMALAEAKKRGESLVGKSQKEQEIIRRNLQAEAKKLVGEMASLARTRAEGGIRTMEEERERIKKDSAANTEAIRGLEERSTQIKKQRDKAAEERDKARTRLKDMKEARAAIEKKIVLMEARLRELEDARQQSREALARATNPTKKRKLEAEYTKLTESVAACQAEAETSYAERKKLTTAETRKQQQALETTLATRTRETAKLTEQLQRLQYHRQLLALEADILAAKLRAAAKIIEVNRTWAKALQASAGDKRNMLAGVLRKQADEAVRELDAVSALMEKRFALQETQAKKTLEACRQRLVQARDEIVAVRQRLEPVTKEFRNWKIKAEKAFTDFLQTYPKSSHVPKNLSRLGTIYLELNQVDQAVATLARLARQYPDAPATREAMFNLGRAQCEQNNLKEATKTFAKLLENPKNIPAPNLRYIAEHLLTDDGAEISLRASQELLRRSADAAAADHATLTALGREPSLYRAGLANMRLHRYDEALKNFATLLSENPHTGYFFDLKFAMAEARRKMTPPDVDGAVADLTDIVRYSEDPVEINKALCLAGEALLAAGDDRSRRQALARFQQVVLLADPTNESNRPWIEKALVESAKGFAALGQADMCEKMMARYRKEFPRGKAMKELLDVKAHLLKTSEN